MKRYLEQLLEDIGEAIQLAPQRLKNRILEESQDEYSILVDESDDYGIKLSELFNLEKNVFPEISSLKDNEIARLIKAKTALWEAYGLNPIFPSNLPDPLKYCQFRNYLHQKVYPEPYKIVDVELCDYLPDDCPFSNHCPIAKIFSGNCYRRESA